MVARLTPEQFEALRQVDSPTISNAIEGFNVRPHVAGYAGYDIRCAYPELGTMMGYAVTCTADSTTESRPRSREGLLKLWEAVAAAPKPVVIVLKDIGSDRLHSCHMGEVMATTARKLGAVGAVSDGGLRDVNEVRALGFHYFCPGFTVSHGNPLIVDVGMEVEVSGLVVKPGDLLHGDVNGLVLIPEAIAARVMEEVEAVRQREAAAMAEIRAAADPIAKLREIYPHH
ncbi:MAG: RraA family protein [Chloroflexi bacterium]|nr:RraA family protein [Chloroflexota bacterium]MCL5110829.1 RraA family protein [Chloroflexota bacterium]